MLAGANGVVERGVLEQDRVWDRVVFFLFRTSAAWLMLSTNSTVLLTPCKSIPGDLFIEGC